MNRKESWSFISDLKAKNKDLKIYSHSKLTAGEQCPHEAYIKYFEKKNGNNIYTDLGTLMHTILEDYDNGVCTSNEEMLEKFNVGFRKATIKYKFPTEKSKNSYYTNMENFFLNYGGIPQELKEKGFKLMTEEFVIYQLSENISAQGFVDLYLVNPETEEFVVIDHKSSTKYTGKKLENQAWQLLLYMEAMKQLTGYSNGRIMWNFTKYAKVSYRLKNGKIKNAVWERKDMIEKMWNEISKRFKEEPVTMVKLKIKREFYTRQIVDEELLTHQLDLKFEDAFVEYEVKDSSSEDVKNWLTEKINKFEERMEIGEDAFPPIKLHDRKDDDGLPFHCSKLCMLKEHCKHYQKLKKKILKSLD